MSWTGTLVRVDLGMGAWVLHTDDGTRLTLYGDVPRALAGQKVVVEGRKRDDVMGFAMVGDGSIEVTRVSAG